MAKGKRKGPRPGSSKPTYGSDDERAYSREAVPDPTSDSFYHDEVDAFHADRDKILLDSQASKRVNEFESNQTEVLAFESESEDDQYENYRQKLKDLERQRHIRTVRSSDEEEDDEEEREEKKGQQQWGTAKTRFYGGHDVDKDYGADPDDDEPLIADLEEQEALAIQRRLVEALDDDDVGLETFKPTEPAAVTVEKVTRDVSELSHREKLKLLKKESPELTDLITEVKSAMDKLQNTLLPILKLIRDNRLPSSSAGAKFVETQSALYLNYTVNLSFYLNLKAKQIPVENHPVIKRLLQYRKLVQQLSDVEPKVSGEIAKLLKKIQAGEEFSIIEEAVDAAPKPRQFKSVLANQKSRGLLGAKKRQAELDDLIDEEDLTKGHKQARLDPTTLNQEVEDGSGLAVEGATEGGGDEAGRRAITYQIEKNKGLSARKKKLQRNPRVKNREKHRRAVIKRKGQVREVKPEMSRYGGELSGIRAGIKRSVKFK